MSNVQDFPGDKQRTQLPPGGNGDGDVRERLAPVEAHMKHMATKAWVLGGVVGGMISAALIALAVVRLFPPT